MGLAAATDIEKLWAAYYSPSMNNQDAAALQVAVWEDVAAKVGTYSITLSDNDPVTTEATTMLDSLGSLTVQADLQDLVSPDGQNYVVPFDVSSVPEPVSAGVLLLGLGVLVCSRDWRQGRRV
jgi:D-serine deaminase-like pyridoxal phosphate-dependent protein